MTSTAAVRREYSKSGARRRQIIDAAMAEILDRGYAGAALSRIAQATSFSIAGVLHHFPSKEIVLHAVLEHAERAIDDTFDSDRERHGFSTAVLRLATAAGGSSPEARLLSLITAEAAAPSHDAHLWLRRRDDALRARLRAGIEDEQRRGRIDPSCDAGLVSSVILSTWTGLQTQALLDPATKVDLVLHHCIEAQIATRFSRTVELMLEHARTGRSDAQPVSVR